MSTGKARVSGAWVDTALEGSARISGAWVPYGPTGGPSYESVTWPNLPTNTDAIDGPTDYYALGAQFHLLTGKLCYGLRWRVPDTAPNPGAIPLTAALWSVATNDQLAVEDIIAVPGGFQDILWDTPVALSGAPAEYVVSVFTHHYTYSAPTPGSGWLVESPTLNIRHDGSRLTGPRTDLPTTLSGWGAFNTWYYISPLIEI